nr:GGDEF domain-containing protein [uncultured Holophaga sp.]
MNLLYPFTLRAEDQVHAEELHGALVEELWKRSRVSMGALLLLLTLLWFTLGQPLREHPGLHWVFLGLASSLILRAVFELVAHANDLSVDASHRLFVVGALLSSSGFVLFNVLATPCLPPLLLAFLWVCEAGICSTAMVSMAGSPLAFSVYMVPIIGSDALLAWIHHQRGVPLMIPVIILFYLATLLVVGFGVHRTLRENLLMRIRLQEAALVDSLTGLPNRRAMKTFIDRESARLLRSWHPEALAQGLPPLSLALVLVDLDFFKAVNDTHGHSAGDEVLVQAAQVLQATVRAPDRVIRWGGEEFVILALESPRSEPLRVAKRIREAVEAHPFALSKGPRLRLTCSVGFALLPFLEQAPAALGWEEVLHLADHALYEAKRRGRNQVVGLMPSGGREETLLRALRGSEEDLQEGIRTELLRWVE